MVAPDQSIKRPLRFWEQVCSFMGVSMGFELEGKITADYIKQAYVLLQKEFPYLRCVLTQDANVLSFVERSPAPVRYSARWFLCCSPEHCLAFPGFGCHL